MAPRPQTARRITVSGLLAGALVVGALATTSAGARVGDLVTGYDESAPTDGETLSGARPHAHPATTLQRSSARDGHDHDHSDPTTKNALSRTGETGPATSDRTSVVEEAAHAAAVARGRETPDPELTTVPLRAPRALHPQTRYAMAGGCYRLVEGSEPLFFQATALGRYLLYDAERRFVAAGGDEADEPGHDTVWTATERGDRIGFHHGDTVLEVDGQTDFLLTRTEGCARYPEAQVNVAGRPFAGVSAFQEVRGYVDVHTHGMAFEFLGGGAHCGKPWDRFGAPYALVDCEDHQTGTNPLEAVLSEEPTHDPVGWPTFKDWPAPNSLTHEGTYYKWMERSWRGGQRLFVNLLVENNQLCRLYPFGPDGTPASKNSCDDMDSVRLQAKRMFQFQDYVDAQWGGPGKGWYRIVTSPWQARRVINDGKLAVVMGIETSVPFGCTFTRVPLVGDRPQCTAEQIDRQLAEVHRLGVRQMELVNKFDNALSGVAGDTGQTGVAVNNANALETGTYWDMRHCEPADPEAHDRNQAALPEISPEQQDALFGAVATLIDTAELPAGPVYDRPDHCNHRGLTALGRHLVDRLASRGMLIDPDHMSVKARKSLLDQVEERRYSGVISSHSWSTADAYPRIYELGGFIAPYAGDSEGFVAKWRRHLGWADPRYYFGFGYGADMNGLGAQGDPRGASAPNPVTYPFEGINGVMVKQQHAGERVYDINVDGVAQYGLYPDWLEDVRLIAEAQQGDGEAIMDDMTRGAEAYLQTWERAQGIAPDSCRNPGRRLEVSAFREAADPGLGTPRLLHRVGQPYLRQDLAYTYCARTDSDPSVRLVVDLDRRGRVVDVRRPG